MNGKRVGGRGDVCVWLYVCVKGRKRGNKLVRECVLFVSVRGRVGVNECECGAFVRACVRARRGRASRSNTWWRCRPAWGGWGTGCRHTCVSGATLARQLLRPSSRSAHIRRSRSRSRSYSYSCSCSVHAPRDTSTRPASVSGLRCVSRRPASRVDFGCGGFGAFEPAECFGIPCLGDCENDLSETHMLLEPRRRPL